jgi:hypothetical protein
VDRKNTVTRAQRQRDCAHNRNTTEQVMSKKHYIAMAEAIAIHNKYGNGAAFNAAQLEVIAQVFKAQNGAFNKEKFFAYIAKQEQK